MSETSRISNDVRSLLDSPLQLADDERITLFNLGESFLPIIQSFSSEVNQVGFLIQLGYFKSSHRFFKPEKYYIADIKYVCILLNIEEINISEYADTSMRRHREIILEILGITPYKTSLNYFHQFIDNIVKQHIDPETIIKELTLSFKKEKRELPSTHYIASYLNQALYDSESKWVQCTKDYFEKHDLNTEVNDFFEPLEIEPGKISTYPKLYRYKKINQSFKPRQLKANSEVFVTFKSLFNQLSSLFDELDISVEIIQHYAIWILKAKTFQIKQLEDGKAKLYLACFIYHHYVLRQDALITSMIKGVAECKNWITSQKKKLQAESASILDELNTATSTSRKELKGYLEQVKDTLENNSLSLAEKLTNIKSIIETYGLSQEGTTEEELERLIAEGEEAKKSYDEYTLLENKSIQIQNRTVPVIIELDFSDETSNQSLLDALLYFKDKETKIDHRSPIDFLTKDEIDHLYDDDNNFRVSLYKALLLTKAVDGIKSGVINLKLSYQYLTINEYMIPSKEWEENRSELIEESDLTKHISVRDSLEFLIKRLSYQYRKANSHINNGLNPYLSFDKEGRPVIRTPAVDKIKMDSVSSLFKEMRYVSILSVLEQINQVTRFISSFKHHSVFVQKVRPDNEIFYAVLLALGANIGTHKLASTSKGISVSKAENVENWYFDKENLLEANKELVSTIDDLHLPTLIKKNAKLLHSSSDGQQKPVAVDSLNSNHSYKYKGLAKGASIYSFIDERNVLFHSTVISPEEREAAYVIDGLLQNNEVKIDIHSTDTHGFTEIIFAVCYLLGISFAPRIKGLKHQVLYSFDSTTYYEKAGYKLKPKKIIQQQKIIDQWDNILRLIATIKLRRASASQIFKRLSSYSLENPLYSALKEFGRIIKSIYLLQYFDDVELRQSIQKQLNIVELSNKFSNAVFFDHNGEFRQETKEEQEVSVLSKQLIQNSIILWNYLYLTHKLINTNSEEHQDIMSIIHNGSIMSWVHINMQGEYDFTKKQNQPPFNIDDVLKYSP